MSSPSRVRESTRLVVGLLIFLVMVPISYSDLGIVGSVFMGYFIASPWWGWVTLRRIFPRWGTYRPYATGVPGQLMFLLMSKWALIALVCIHVGLVSQPIEIILCIRRIRRDYDELQKSVDLRGSQGVQVGGSNAQSNTFTMPVLTSTPATPPPTEPTPPSP